MKVTYLGTTMLLFDDGKDQILFDCHVTRPSIPKFLGGTFETDTAVCQKVIDDFHIDRLKAMFISHSHHDHVMDMPYFQRASRCDVYGSASAVNVGRGGDVPEEKLHEYKNGDTFEIGSYRISVMTSLHSKPSFFNNDIGQTIDEPLHQPAKSKDYKEGGSYDFLVEHSGRKYLIRPSYNFIPRQLDNVKADVLFLAIAGLAGDDTEHKEQFWKETVDKVQPKLVIPLHWDNFFTPLYGPLENLPKMFEFTGKGMNELAIACSKRNINCVVQLPLSSMEV